MFDWAGLFGDTGILESAGNRVKWGGGYATAPLPAPPGLAPRAQERYLFGVIIDGLAIRSSTPVLRRLPARGALAGIR